MQSWKCRNDYDYLSNKLMHIPQETSTHTGVPQETSRVNIDAFTDYSNKPINDWAEMMNVLGNIIHARETISTSFFSF